MDLDNAIKAIYKPKYTNIKEDPGLRTKFGSNGSENESSPKKVESYLYGKQNNKCENHCHSKYCSKHKDIDLAAIQS